MKNPDSHLLDQAAIEAARFSARLEYSVIAKNLWLAAERIEKFGHCKGKLNVDGRTCAFGALGRVATVSGIAAAAANFMEDVLNIPNLVRWNDAPERTAEDVILAFRKASLIASERASC